MRMRRRELEICDLHEMFMILSLFELLPVPIFCTQLTALRQLLQIQLMIISHDEEGESITSDLRGMMRRTTWMRATMASFTFTANFADTGKGKVCHVIKKNRVQSYRSICRLYICTGCPCCLLGEWLVK